MASRMEAVMTKNRCGFTLIETMVVFAVVVILSTVAFISLKGTNLAMMNKQAIQAGQEIAKIVVQLKEQKINIADGNYSSDDFYEQYHIKLPKNPFGKTWNITNSYVTPCDANGHPISELKVSIYSVNGALALKYERFDDSHYDTLHSHGKYRETITGGMTILKDENFFHNYKYWQTASDNAGSGEIESPFVLFKQGEVDLLPHGMIYQYSNISLNNYSNLYITIDSKSMSSTGKAKISIVFYKGMQQKASSDETISIKSDRAFYTIKVPIPEQEFDKIKITIDNNGSQTINIYGIRVLAKISGF